MCAFFSSQLCDLLLALVTLIFDYSQGGKFRSLPLALLGTVTEIPYFIQHFEKVMLLVHLPLPVCLLVVDYLKADFLKCLLFT